MSRAQTTLHVILAVLFLTSLLPTGQAASDPATTAQEAAIEAADGITVPSTVPWQVRNEDRRLYFDTVSSQNVLVFTAPGGTATQAVQLAGPAAPTVDPGAPSVTPASPAGATFVLGTTAAEMEISSFSTNVWITTTTATTVTVRLIMSNPDGTSPVDLYTGTINIAGVLVNIAQVANTPTEFTASQTATKLVPAGMRLAVHVGAASTSPLAPLNTVTLHYDSGNAQSRVSFTADAARVKTWAESINAPGVAKANFVSPSDATAEARTLDLQIASVHALNRSAPALKIIGPAGKVHYDSTGIPAAADIAPSGQLWGAAPGTPQDKVTTVTGVDVRTHRLTYPNTLLPGVYTVRLTPSCSATTSSCWTVDLPLSIGATGGTLELATNPNELAQKTILVGERTSFRLVVRNNAVVTDTFALQASPGTNPPGWTASIVPAQVVLGPGASTEVELRVVPAANGANGQTNTIAATATSLSSGQSFSLPNPVRVTLANVATRGVEIVNRTINEAAIPVSVSPGGARSEAMVIENLGNGFDRFVVSLTGAPTGWTVSANPGLVELEARSQGASVIRIEAPTTVSPTTPPFTLTMRAARLDDATKFDTQTFTVSVAIQDRFSFQAENGTLVDGTVANPVVHVLRDEGPDGTTQTGTAWDDTGVTADHDYDQTALFRLVLRNDGDRADTYALTPYVLTDGSAGAGQLATAADRTRLGFLDRANCDGSTANDGWRMRMYEPGTAPAFSAGPESFTQVRDNRNLAITLAPKETKVVYVELKWVVPAEVTTPAAAVNGCGDSVQGAVTENGGQRTADPAPGHAVLVEAVSGHDPSKRTSQVVNARLNIGGAGGKVGNDRYQNAAHATFVVADGPSSKLVTTVAGQRTTTYDLHAVNAGNEMDTLRITVPQYSCPSSSSTASQCWEHGFQNLDTRGVMSNDAGKTNGGTCTTPAVSNPTASLAARIVAFECTLGVFDEVVFKTFSTAPAGGAIGALDSFRVTVASKDSFNDPAGTKFDDQVLETRITGEYALDVVAAATSAPVYAGESAAVSFSLRNLGTNNDNYTIDLRDNLATGWSADFSVPNPIFVPAGRQVDVIVFARAPASAAVGDSQLLQVRATSLNSPALVPPVDNITLRASVAAKPTLMTLAGDPQNLLGAPGTTVHIKATATKATGSPATTVNFTLDASSLPPGWTPVGATSLSGRTLTTTGTTAHFNVTVPANALGSSRAAVRILADDGASRPDAFTSIGISVEAPNLGIQLLAPAGNTVFVAPGAATRMALSVQNLGVTQDRISLTTGTLPAGWSAVFDASSLNLQPLETRTTNVTVTAPSTLIAGQSRILTFTATTQDGVQSDSLQVNFTTGTSILQLTPKVNGTLSQLPLEPFSFVVTVNNTGDLPDAVVMRAGAGAFKDIVTFGFSPAEFDLDVGQALDVTVTATYPVGLAANLEVPLVVEAASRGPFLTSVGATTVATKVIDHKVRDVDGDGTNEYAVDRDLDASNGYEGYRDPSLGAGASVLLNPTTFLSEAAKARFTVQVTQPDGNTTPVLRFLFDPDADLRADLLIDTNADGKPDVYWDGDRGYSHLIPVAKDVTKDGREDYFFDLDGEGGLLFDVYYDPLEGRVGRLIQVDIDNNGVLDYVVDANGNGNPDLTETVLFGGPDGRIVSIQEKVDVDGDGNLDTVIDSDGNGKPDYFIAAGKTSGVKITLEDVNGDGVDDWTYDSDGNGRRDAYYDPATGQTGFLDPKSDFMDQLTQYWYIGALFGVVLVLFVVLLLVTRK